MRFCRDGLNDHCITNANYSSGLNHTKFLSPTMTCQSLLSLHWRRDQIHSTHIGVFTVFPRLNSWGGMSSKMKDRLALVQRRKWKAVQETHTSILACSVRLLVRSSRNFRSAESVITAGNTLEPPEPTEIQWRQASLLFSRTHIQDGTEMDGSTTSAGSSEGVNFDYSRQVGAPVGWNLGSSSPAQSAPR